MILVYVPASMTREGSQVSSLAYKNHTQVVLKRPKCLFQGQKTLGTATESYSLEIRQGKSLLMNTDKTRSNSESLAEIAPLSLAGELQTAGRRIFTTIFTTLSSRCIMLSQ
jgi:hypothetical protein